MDTPILKKLYKEQGVPELMKQFGYKNLHQVPNIQKVVINTGFGVEDKGVIDDVVKQLGQVTGQQPVVTKARISVSNFKLRAGMPIGAKVDLRGARMWDFLYRLINVALPAIRDFRGVANKLDGRGNYTLGIEDISIFPEINVEQQKRSIGLDIAIVTTAESDEEGRELLRLLGMPFRRPTSGGANAADDAAGQSEEAAVAAARA